MTAGQFRFGSYNFEDGGIDGGCYDRLRRQLAMLAMLAAAEADAWAFQECKGWRNTGIWRLFRRGRAFRLAENTLGMRGYLARSSHHGCDVAVFVRESAGIRVTGQRHEERPPYWHAVARLDVEVSGFGPLHLASAHLAPSSAALRLIEAEALALIAGNDVPVIIGGDWNAVPASDPDPDVTGADPGKARRKLDRSAARAMEEAGFIDVGAYLGNPAPTVGHAGGLFYRCDRCKTTLPTEAVTGHGVIRKDKPDSDHRPVVAAFDLDAATGRDAG